MHTKIIGLFPVGVLLTVIPSAIILIELFTPWASTPLLFMEMNTAEDQITIKLINVTIIRILRLGADLSASDENPSVFFCCEDINDEEDVM